MQFLWSKSYYFGMQETSSLHITLTFFPPSKAQIKLEENSLR